MIRCMRIGELARLVGMRDSLIRHYEDQGLLATRDRNGPTRGRDYDQADLERLFLIRTALRNGIGMEVLLSVTLFLDEGVVPDEASLDLTRQALETTDSRLRYLGGLRDVLAAVVLAAGAADGT